MDTTTNTLSETIKVNIQLIQEEHHRLYASLHYQDLARLSRSIHSAQRIFLIGAGRTGLSLKSFAMRLMHLGYEVFVVGEILTPAIAFGDTLIIASGSGTTRGLVNAAQTAVKSGAMVIALSTNAESPISQLAAYTVVIPAAQKQDHSTVVSKQYAGSLFEQALLLITDAIFHTLWVESAVPAERLWKRHANLE